MAGVGQEGEELVRKTIGGLVESVETGRGKAVLKEEGFEVSHSFRCLI